MKSLSSIASLLGTAMILLLAAAACSNADPIEETASEPIVDDVGRGGGPDLSTVVSRFRRREILESIVYPSRVISDQYSALRIELQDGRSYVGMHAAESEESLTLITAIGERVVLDKDEIVAREIAEVSLMPEGLLEAMSFDDLMSLMRYLEEGQN